MSLVLQNLKMHANVLVLLPSTTVVLRLRANKCFLIFPPLKEALYSGGHIFTSLNRHFLWDDFETIKIDTLIKMFPDAAWELLFIRFTHFLECLVFLILF